MSHSCPVAGCTSKVLLPDSILMCGPDWRRVPNPLRKRVYSAYADGQGIGSPTLERAQKAAVRAAQDARERTS